MIIERVIAGFILLITVAAMEVNAENRPNAGAEPGITITADEQLASLIWLSGTWYSDEFEAHYTTPGGGMMFSISKFMEDGKAVYFDFERIQVIDGVVVLTPYPGGKESVPFRLAGYDPKVKKAIFKNPEHDFPKQLQYELVGPDDLVIQVSGTQDGKEATMRFELKRRK